MKRSGVAELPLHGGLVPERTIETRLAPEANFGALIAHEKAISPSLDGRSVLDDKPRGHFFVGRDRQQKLF